MNTTVLLLAVLALPLAGSLPALFVGRAAEKLTAGWAACCLLAALGISLYVAIGLAAPVSWSQPWLAVGRLSVDAGLYADAYTMSLLVIVTGIAAAVQIFSISYLAGEERFRIYVALIGFFTFAMLLLLLSRHLVILYLSWELVGAASYLLIGFWRERPQAIRAAKKAFLLNRIGDAGLMIGILGVYQHFGTLDIPALSVVAGDTTASVWLWVAGLGIFVGAMGKSAQFPLSVWLPDAMEGPTPASALIHAATMVAAGVYLCARLFPVLEAAQVLPLVVWIGLVSALTAAISALVQHDLKKTLAYSTISQLGLMMAAVGAGGPGAAMFHLITHAFFKAGLFLAAGNVIHGLHGADDPQDMRQMGGLWRKMPWTFGAFGLAALALAGFPFFSGFFSKETILLYLFERSAIWGWTAWVVSLLTAVYVWRMITLVFMGESRSMAAAQAHEVGMLMRVPVLLLGLAVWGFWFVGFSLDPAAAWLWSYWQIALPTGGSGLFWLSVAASAGGFAVSHYWMRQTRWHLADDHRLLQAAFHFGWLSEMWNRLADVFVRPTSARPALFAVLAEVDRRQVDGMVMIIAKGTAVLGYVAAWVDRYLVDGTVYAVTTLLDMVGGFFRAWHSGRLQWYLWSLLAALLLWGAWQCVDH